MEGILLCLVVASKIDIYCVAGRCDVTIQTGLNQFAWHSHTTTTTTTTVCLIPTIEKTTSTKMYSSTMTSDQEFVTMDESSEDRDSSFVLGEDWTFSIGRGMVGIISRCYPCTFIKLDSKQWANFQHYCGQINNEVKALIRKMQPVDFLVQISDGYFVFVKYGWNHVDITHYYIPYGESYEPVHRTVSAFTSTSGYISYGC